MNYFIRNACIINEGQRFTGSLLTEGDRIKAIFRGDCKEPEGKYTLIEAGGKWLIPGVIDDQVHFREPGLTRKGDIGSESASGVAGGVTSYMEMPNTQPPTLSATLLKEKQDRASETSLANFSFYIGTSNDNFRVLSEVDPETVCGIKVFMGSSTGNLLVDNPDTLREIFSQRKLPVAVHCEDEATIRHNLEKYRTLYGDQIPPSCHPEIRSEEACYRSSALAAELAHRYGAHLHLLHLSTAKELSLLSNRSPLEEKQITAEVCVHHLWFDQRDYAKLGNFIKWNPAIKTERDKEALLEAVKNQTLDMVATDHAPHTLEEKQKPYLQAPSGGPLLQHALVMMLELARQGKITPEEVIRSMCHHPSTLFKVRERGFLREGYYADLVLVDPDAPWEVSRENILARCGWSPLEGERFHSRVTHTWVNGALVYEQGILHPENKGRMLQFNR